MGRPDRASRSRGQMADTGVTGGWRGMQGGVDGLLGVGRALRSTVAVSALGDTALLAPASLLLLAYLALCRCWRPALAFGTALVLTGAATLASKLLFHACGSTFEVNVTSPSGHASFAALFYGSLALMLATGQRPWWKLVVMGASGALLLAIGWSRVRLGAHSGTEVAIGLAIGLSGVGVFAALRGTDDPPVLWPFIVAGGLAASYVVVSGRHFTVEHQIARAAGRLAVLDICSDRPQRRAGFPALSARLGSARPTADVLAGGKS